MKYIELYYNWVGNLFSSNYNGKTTDLNQISQIIFDIIQESEIPPKFFRFHTPQNFSSPETIKNFLANFNETYLRNLKEILTYKGINLIVKGDDYKYNLRENKMTKEQLRMQMIAGVITESEYAAVINKEIEEADKASLNESMIGGIVGIGAINQIPATPKTDYEMAFEHFLGERYEVKPNRERDDIKDVNEDETSEMEDEVEDEISMNEEELDESVLAVAGGIVLGILGLKTLARIMKGIFGAVSLIKMTDPKKLKESVAEIGREAIMKRGKNPLQVALWMTTVNSMIDSGEVKNGVDLGKTWGNIDKIDLEKALNSGESEEGKEVEEPNNY